MGFIARAFLEDKNKPQVFALITETDKIFFLWWPDQDTPWTKDPWKVPPLTAAAAAG
ncbi:hypothetical protein GCM10018953_65640 [Streptosporangium nondiastaticum]